MSKRFFVWMFAAAVCLLFISVENVSAQSRKAVSGAEVNGTFRDNFGGSVKGFHNEIKILALGQGKLKVSFDLVYPYRDSSGQMTANMGTGEGEALIVGDTATYSSSEFGECKITIKFVKPGTIKVSDGTDSACGFGFNVTPNGTYKKVSSAKPKF